MHLNDLYDIQELLKETEEDSKKLKEKKNEIMINFDKDLGKIVEKYENLYIKHIIQDKKHDGRTKLSEKEKELDIVSRSLKTFMPLILIHNLIAYGEFE